MLSTVCRRYAQCGFWTSVRCVLTRMSHSTNHLEGTAGNTHNQDESEAVVKAITNLSDTVKGFTLQVAGTHLSFKAGQWIDLTIPGVSTVGGFSMCSAPSKLIHKGELDLAIKYSSHPPAHWAHTQCQVGSKVSLRVGGDFYYDPSKEEQKHTLVLIAGGVGINPIFSIVQHLSDLGSRVNTVVLYSAASMKELIFKDQLEQLASCDDYICCRFFITKETTEEGVHQDQTHLTYRRIDESAVSAALDHLGSRPKETTSYMCGPSPMIDDMENYLTKLGLPKADIHYEKWW